MTSDIAKIAAGQEEPVLTLTRELREQITKEAGAQFKMSVLLKCVQAAIEANGLVVVPVEVLQAIGGEAAIEAKRLFDRMLTTPRHTPKRKELAARHYEASKRAAMVSRAMLAASPLRGEG